MTDKPKVEIGNYDTDFDDPKQVAFYLRGKGEEECADLVKDLAEYLDYMGHADKFRQWRENE